MNQLELKKKAQKRIALCLGIRSFSRVGGRPFFSVCDALTLVTALSVLRLPIRMEYSVLTVLIIQSTFNSPVSFLIHVFIHSSNIY